MSEPGGWFNCQVVMAGPAEDENIYIRLRERQGTFERWYSAVPRIRREMLATALTAISLGLSVDVSWYRQPNTAASTACTLLSAKPV